jgi:hypothetical protein
MIAQKYHELINACKKTVTMCGINGILHFQSQRKVDERILTKCAIL